MAHLVLLVLTTIDVFQWVQGDRLLVSDKLVFLGLIAVSWVLLVRLMRIGIYTADSAVRVRSLFRTRTLPWSEVVEVETARGRLLGLPLRRDTIWLRLRSGRRIPTLVQRQVRGRELLALSGNDFDDAVGTLRRRLGAGHLPSRPPQWRRRR